MAASPSSVLRELLMGFKSSLSSTLLPLPFRSKAPPAPKGAAGAADEALLAAPADKKAKIDLGAPELTRLWNISRDNLEGCRQTALYEVEKEVTDA